MTTSLGTQPKDVTEIVRQLVEIDYDAIEGYSAAIDRLENETFRDQLTSFKEDHQRHIADLGAELVSLGERVPSGPDLKGIVGKGKVVMGGFLGDLAILLAMKTNEEDSNEVYERAAERRDFPAPIRRLIERGRADEQEHLAWIETQLSGFDTAATVD